MSQIRIKNFGPIKDGYQENDGWLDIKKVTVFIGNQGSGKSTVAKLISTLSWIEKALVRGDYNSKWFTQRKRFQNVYCKYHRLENYFYNENKQDVADIEFEGEAVTIVYKNGILSILENKKDTYQLPQIMYVPAERNFISTVRKPDVLKFSSESLVEFVTEFDNAKNNIKGHLLLPINNTSVEYDKLNDIINVKGNDYKLRLTEASSGFQSLVPLYLVSRYLANKIENSLDKVDEPMSSDELERFRKEVLHLFQDKNLTNEQRRVAFSVISKKFNKTAFINIVEEPEQNLFPSSQRHILNSLLEFNNMNEGNKLIMTTHSPYIINYLSIAIQGDYLLNKIKLSKKPEKSLDRHLLVSELENVVPLKSVISATDVVIYQLDDLGNIKKLPNYEGIPSDDNYLNASIAEGNNLFDKLLEIEEEI